MSFLFLCTKPIFNPGRRQFLFEDAPEMAVKSALLTGAGVVVLDSVFNKSNAGTLDDLVIQNPMPDFQMLPESNNLIYTYDINYTGPLNNLQATVSGNDPASLGVNLTMEKINQTQYKLHVDFNSLSNLNTQDIVIEISDVTTSIGQDPKIFEGYNLKQNFPSPVGDETTIQFSIPKQENVRIDVYNVLGQRVKTLTNRTYAAGENHTVKWDGTNKWGAEVGEGLYFYRMQAGAFSKVKKMTLTDGTATGGSYTQRLSKHSQRQQEVQTQNLLMNATDDVTIQISENEPTVSMDRGFHVDASVQGVPLSIQHLQGGPPGNYLITQVSNMPEILENANLIFSNDPLTSSHGPEYTIPISIHTPSTSFRQDFEISEKVNRYYNEAVMYYNINGTAQNPITFYSPDDAASLLLNNIATYAAGSYSITPSTQSQFAQNYDAMQADPDLMTRMSHYNYNWDQTDQIIDDVAHSQNNHSLQQVLWNVYNFGGTEASKMQISSEDEVLELELPKSVVDNWKNMYSKLETTVGSEEAAEKFSEYYQNSNIGKILKAYFSSHGRIAALRKLLQFENLIQQKKLKRIIY